MAGKLDPLFVRKARDVVDFIQGDSRRIEHPELAFLKTWVTKTAAQVKKNKWGGGSNLGYDYKKPEDEDGGEKPLIEGSHN